MKTIRKILSIIIVFAMLFSIPITAYASTKTTSPYTSKTYTHQTKQDGKKIHNGIDISEHNGTINWAKVAKKASFAIIRVGFRGWASEGTLVKDVKFNTNIKNAKANGVKVGIYFYSQALTTTEAKQEAQKTLEWMGENELDLPIFFDYEFADTYYGRLDNAWRNGTVTKSKMTKNAIAYLDTINNAGYTAMIYANRSFLSDHVDYKEIEKAGYGIWVAEYNNSTSFAGNYSCWQYSDVGKIDGINDTNVDCNFWYGSLDTQKERFDIEKIPSQAHTGIKIKPTITVKYNNKVLESGKDYYITYTNNVNIGTATAIVTGIDDYEDFAKTNVPFSIVPSKVTGVTLTNVTTNTATIKWDKHSQANGYNVYVYRAGVWKLYSSTTKTEMTINSLSSATNYPIRVTAYKTVNGENIVGKNSDKIYATTIPAKTGDITYTSSSSALTLTWSKQTNATGYQVEQYDPSTKKYVLTKDVVEGANSVRIYKLNENTAYKYRIIAYKVDHDKQTIYGAYSDPYTAYTRPLKMTVDKLTTPAKRTIKTSWNVAQGITGYQVQWSTNSDFSSNYKSVYVTDANATYTNLATARSNQKYYVRIRSYKTRNGTKKYSTWSVAKSITTK